MVVLFEQIAAKTKGALAEDEDWWRLGYDTESGEYFVEHEWSHTNPYKIGSGHHEGSKRYALEGWDGEGKENVPAAMAAIKAKIA